MLAAVPVEDKSQMDLSNDPRDPLPLDHGDPQPDGIRENKPA